MAFGSTISLHAQSSRRKRSPSASVAGAWVAITPWSPTRPGLSEQPRGYWRSDRRQYRLGYIIGDRIYGCCVQICRTRHASGYNQIFLMGTRIVLAGPHVPRPSSRTHWNPVGRPITGPPEEKVSNSTGRWLAQLSGFASVTLTTCCFIKMTTSKVYTTRRLLSGPGCG